jgi:hypothetical protein
VIGGGHNSGEKDDLEEKDKEQIRQEDVWANY